LPIVGSSTKQVSDAITRAQNEFKGITLATVDSLDFANEIYQMMGLATYWDWLLTAGTAFGTVKDQQDYVNVPVDFRRMADNMAWVNDDSSTYNPMLPLAVRETLPKSTTRGTPRAIAAQNPTTFRLFPVPIVTRSTPGQWNINFEYWKMPKRLSSLVDLFEFPDQYFEIYLAGFIARVGDFVHDERAGQWLGRNPQNAQFAGTGMWGKFAGLLNNAVREEEMASGSIIWAPDSEFMRF
jgi:hypothetical protein